jgi:sugar phosphate isomerase/epimerase
LNTAGAVGHRVFTRPAPDPEPVDATLDLDLGFTLPLRDVRRGVEWAAAEGFDHVEVLLDGPHARARTDAWRDPLADALDDTGLDVIVHLPFTVDLGSPFGPVRDGAVRECRACLDLAAGLDARKAVFHPSSDAWDKGWTGAERREFVVDGTRRVVRAARERGVAPVPENIIHGPFVAAEFGALFEALGDAADGLGTTFDTAHAVLGDPAVALDEYAAANAGRIDHLHLSDTRGGGDEHLPAGMGELDFRGLFASLDGWSGTATLEVGTRDLETIALGKRHVDRLLGR